MGTEQEIFEKCGKSYNPGDTIFREAADPPRVTFTREASAALR